MHPRLEIPIKLAELLLDAAVVSARAAAKAGKSAAHRPRRGQLTLKPGPETPLWNELAAAVEGAFQRYGDKARLGRILGLPRQRIHDLLRQRRHLPDAERTLLLLVWLSARSQGKDLA